MTSENYSVLKDLKLIGFLFVKALLCFLKRLWDVTVSSLCPADSSLNLKMFCPGFSTMPFERAILMQIVRVHTGPLFTFFRVIALRAESASRWLYSPSCI